MTTSMNNDTDLQQELKHMYREQSDAECEGCMDKAQLLAYGIQNIKDRLAKGELYEVAF